MNVLYRVTLSDEERTELERLVSGGKGPVRKLKRAQTLLAADAGATAEVIALNVSTSTSTVFRTKQRFVEEGLAAALSEEPRPGAERKLSVGEEALLVAMACSKPPTGRAVWTMELLADEMVRLTSHESLSAETVRRRLVEKELKPWQKKMWCIPKVDSEFVARMEDVLDLAAEPPDAKRPAVYFDETPRQLIGEARVPVAAKPGQPARVDYEYVRNGTANVFMFFDAHRKWRHAKVTDRRANGDFAHCMRHIVEAYPDAEVIRVVLDNLNTHKPASLYEAFPHGEARAIVKKLEFHFTPKHGSWLNIAENELSTLTRQCLARRIATLREMRAHVNAWQKKRNKQETPVRWRFTLDRARERMRRVYPRLED